MDGVHDMGGRQGFGPVRYTLNAPAFHAEWEKRVNSLYALAVRLGIFNMDEYRHAIERMEPRHYLAASYYERSLTSLATLPKKVSWSRGTGASRARLVSALRPECARAHQPAKPRALHAGRSRPRAPRLCTGHVRMPGYIRGKTGVVVGDRRSTTTLMLTRWKRRTSPRMTSLPSQDLAEFVGRRAHHVGLFQSYLERDA
jgi:nitrile hydratase